MATDPGGRGRLHYFRGQHDGAASVADGPGRNGGGARAADGDAITGGGFGGGGADSGAAQLFAQWRSDIGRGSVESQQSNSAAGADCGGGMETVSTFAGARGENLQRRNFAPAGADHLPRDRGVDGGGGAFAGAGRLPGRAVSGKFAVHSQAGAPDAILARCLRGVFLRVGGNADGPEHMEGKLAADSAAGGAGALRKICCVDGGSLVVPLSLPDSVSRGPGFDADRRVLVHPCTGFHESRVDFAELIPRDAGGFAGYDSGQRYDFSLPETASRKPTSGL